MSTPRAYKDIQPSLASFAPRPLEDMIRLGRAYDGGYVVNKAAILASRYLISFGLCDDWSFELDFLKQKPDLEILCFDHSVSHRIFSKRVQNALSELLSLRFLFVALKANILGVRERLAALKHSATLRSGFSSFASRRNVHFVCKGISNQRDRYFITLDDVFGMVPQDKLVDNSVFIKMDIELSEFRVLPYLAKFDKYVCGMVVEFHDLDILWPTFVELINELKGHFEITHIHGNNYGGLIPDSTIPRTLEITFLKKTLIDGTRVSSDGRRYPVSGLDYPNDPLRKDYPIDL